ncbi:ribonuclease HII [Flagellimonas hymeniacidonis]|uniref:Ribonuclease HII n=1 Tax=Flagellimonas hymeniacidonis TaxID=2603628 RepID=A0A5C8V9P0_9FLAO|nr:ribonuclease HII [Flagellimonas hymeniacidonis]TXN38387.1 ribonuclease HII [Flagellimonas hymeniacidonis]
MKSKAFLTLLILFLLSCKTEIKQTDSLLGCLPQNASFIIKINQLSNFRSELKNNTFLEKTNNFTLHKEIVNALDGFEYIKTDANCLLAFYEIGKDNYEFILVSDKGSDIFDISEANNKTVETLSYQDQNITKYSIEDYEVYSILRDNTIILGSSLMLMENIARTKSLTTVNPSLQKLYETSGPNKSATLFINLDEPSSLLSAQQDDDENDIKFFSDWISLDFSANSDNSNLNGVAVASDSTKNFINLFKGTNPLSNKTPTFAPLNAQAIVSYTFDDYQVFAKNQNTYLDRVKPIDTLFNTIEEVGIIYLNTEKVVLLNSFGTESLSEFLNEDKTSSTTYQGSEIISLKNNNLVVDGFDPLLKNFKSNFCTILENTFVFSEKREPLQTVISNFKSASSFSKAPVYTTATAAMANESSMLFISDASGVDHLSEEAFIPKLFNEIKKANFKDFAFAAQMVADTDFVHANFLASKIGQTVKTNSVTPLFTLELDTDLAIDPQFVKNHRTNKQEIVVQDQNNFLYLISTDGKVLWKKQLNGRIQGRIEQVDIYKNGRLQLAFCTNNQFLIIDRNGEDVPPFTKTFEGGNLNPLAVFDYEGKKDYRFLVTQGEKVYMYNNKAEIVSGFTYTRANSPIIASPKHFRVSNKDYLVFQLEDKTLKILHRSGGDRIKVSQKIDFSENEVFLYKNKFSVTNKKGVLHQIDLKGKLTSTNFNLNKDHGMYATSKTLVFMDDNVLSIRGKKVELDLGVYSKPKIFYIYDKIYVSVTDIQNQKIFLFDSQAKPISNFPVFGNSLIDLIDTNNDKKLELVAKDQENSIIVYKMN